MRRLLAAALVLAALILAGCSAPMDRGVVIDKDHTNGHFMYCGKGCMMWVRERYKVLLDGVDVDGLDATEWAEVDKETWLELEIGDYYEVDRHGKGAGK
jgi:hypothetical protein